MRIALELYRGADGRVEGRLDAASAVSVPFCGLLELIRCLEDLDLERPPGADDVRSAHGG